jgi:hypothetical protein
MITALGISWGVGFLIIALVLVASLFTLWAWDSNNGIDDLRWRCFWTAVIWVIFAFFATMPQWIPETVYSCSSIDFPVTINGTTIVIPGRTGLIDRCVVKSTGEVYYRGPNGVHLGKSN